MGIETERATVRQEFEKRVSRIETFVKSHGDLFRDIATRKDELCDRVDNFRYHHERLDKSLVILLLGGTGTGKSTLINALAGREISGTAVRRAYTENYFIFHHRKTPIAFLNPALGQGDQWIPHDRETLREKVIIDAPDFDSLKQVNRDKALAMLELADLVIAMVTSEKYRDRTLHDILGEARAVKRFLFVYNKIDREFSEKVVEQLAGEIGTLGIQGRIFRVSALAAFKNATDGGGRDAGEFGDLVQVIERELDHAQIREIKRKNLDGLFTTIREQVLQSVPADFADRVGRLGPGLEGILAAASLAASRQVTSDVFAEEEGELAGILKSIQYYSFGGVFGFYLTLVDKLRALRPGYVSVGQMDQFRMRRVLSRHCDRIQARRIRETMEGAADQAGKALREVGVSEDLSKKLREVLEGEVFYQGLAEEVTDGMSRDFFGQFERYCLWKEKTGSIRLRNFLFNVLPTGFCLFVLGNLVYQYFWRNKFLGTEYLWSSLVVLLVLNFLVQLAAEKRFARENWTFLAEMQDHVRERVDEFLGSKVGEELAAIRRRVEAVRDDLAAIASEDLPGAELLAADESAVAPAPAPAATAAPQA